MHKNLQYNVGTMRFYNYLKKKNTFKINKIIPINNAWLDF